MPPELTTLKPRVSASSAALNTQKVKGTKYSPDIIIRGWYNLARWQAQSPVVLASATSTPVSKRASWLLVAQQTERGWTLLRIRSPRPHMSKLRTPSTGLGVAAP